MAISVSPRAGVGSRLREAREERGVSLEDAARETRIKPRFLDALEQDAPPSAFRAPVYARAFLREYARFLGLDPEPIVERYARAHAIAEPSTMRLPTPVRTPRRLRMLQGFLAVAVVAGVTVVAVLASRPGEREVPPASDNTAAARGPLGDALEDEVRLRLRVNGGTWLSVAVDGERVVRGRKRPGFEREFRAEKRIRMEVADGGAVRLRLNDEPLGVPANDGVTYRAVFALRDGRVVVEDDV